MHILKNDKRHFFLKSPGSNDKFILKVYSMNEERSKPRAPPPPPRFQYPVCQAYSTKEQKQNK